MDTMHVVNYVPGAKVTLDCFLDVQQRNHPDHAAQPLTIFSAEHSGGSYSLFPTSFKNVNLLKCMLKIGHVEKWSI